MKFSNLEIWETFKSWIISLKDKSFVREITSSNWEVFTFIGSVKFLLNSSFKIISKIFFLSSLSGFAIEMKLISGFLL
ncbi:hypothetical protein [Mesomycoplasma hyorhinis]|uniref:hypothetical protein n=1 Tax=Mesomycoplasma hyorhinis TaxID=2100 RepID=UPI001F17718A|nr:hypothetical protein [Mesomycoplasma hyorhinis]